MLSLFGLKRRLVRQKKYTPAVVETDAQEGEPVPTAADTAGVQVEERVELSAQPIVPPTLSRASQPYHWPWLSILALLLGIIAQSGLEMATRSAGLGIAFYGLAAAALVAAVLRKEWQIADLPEDAPGPMPTTVHGLILLLGGVFAVLAYITFSEQPLYPNKHLPWPAGIDLCRRGFLSFCTEV